MNLIDKKIIYFQNKKEKDFWFSKLDNIDEISTIPYDFFKLENTKYSFINKEFIFSQQISDNIIKLAGNSDTRIHVFLTACLNILVYKYSQSNDVIIGSTINKQLSDKELVNNILILRNKIDPDLSFKKFLLQIANSVLESIDNQNFPVCDAFKNLNPQHTSFFDISIISENLHSADYFNDVQYNLGFEIRNIANKISINLSYNSDLYAETTITGLFMHYENIITFVLSNIDGKLSEIPIVDEKEKDRILNVFNKQKDYPQKELVHQLFEKQAKDNPDNIALIYNESRFTFREINEEANKLANYLLNMGFSRGSIAALLIDRSHKMMISIFAVWKLGGVYAPFDKNSPINRINQQLNDSNADLIIVEDDSLKDELKQNYGSKVLHLDNLQDHIAKEDSQNPDIKVYLNDPAYIIYTSGSTGKPKGAIIEHQGMLNHIFEKANDLIINENSIIAQNSSHTFDISVWQLFAGVAFGGKTIIYSNQAILDVSNFIKSIEKEQVTILEVVPSYLDAILNSSEINNVSFSKLQFLIATGEEIKSLLVKRWYEKFSLIKLVNAYGPTEASDDITHFIIDTNINYERIPIGKPLNNATIYIVDNEMQLCPVGVKGEICVSGIVVGKGYLNDIEKTNTSFVIDPFNNKGFSRLYKTGDLGKWLPDGTIEFYGRKDYQVKIRGFRIELEEISKTLQKLDEIKEAVVLDVDINGSKYLNAYFITSKDKKLEIEKIKKYLSGQLPYYMVPDNYIPVEKFPLTPHGKIDRKALISITNNGEDIIPFFYSDRLSVHVKKKDTFEDELQNIVSEAYSDIIETLNNELSVINDFGLETKREYYPLSFSQKMIYYTEKRFPKTSCDVLGIYYVFNKIFDKNLIERAINLYIENNTGLRLRITEVVTENVVIPAQYIKDYSDQKIDFFDLSDLNPNEQNNWIKNQINKPFSIIDSQLFYIAILKFNNKLGLLFKTHHIISDGSTINFFCTEIIKYYNALATNKLINNGSDSNYINYIFNEIDYLRSNQAIEDMNYWFKSIFPIPEKKILYKNPNNVSDIKGEVYINSFPTELRTKLIQYAQENKVTLYQLVLSAVAIYNFRKTGATDLVIGCVSHGRMAKEYKRTAGVFIKFLPLRIECNPNADFAGFVKNESARQLMGHLRHQRFPFELMANKIKNNLKIDLTHFYDVNLIDLFDLNDEDCQRFKQYQGSESTPLTIRINPSNKNIEGILEIEWNYQTARFDKDEIKLMHKSLINILYDGVNNPAKAINEIDLIHEEEKKSLINFFSFEDVIFPEYLKADVPNLPGSRILILSDNMKFQPAGMIGNMYIASGLDGTRDITSDFPSNKKNNEQLTDSNMLAYYTFEGKIKVLGNKSGISNFNGHLINLEQIQYYLNAFQNVENSKVIIRGEHGQQQDLYAFIIAKGEIRESELRSFLQSRLENFQIPHTFIQIDKFPQDISGEIDETLLKNCIFKIKNKSQYSLPRNETEKLAVKILNAMFNHNEIGIDDNFFTMGGNSLLAINFVSKLQQHGIQINIEDVFQYQTIRNIFDRINSLNTKIENIEEYLNREHLGQIFLKKYKQDNFDVSILYSLNNNSNVIPEILKKTRIEEYPNFIRYINGADEIYEEAQLGEKLYTHNHFSEEIKGKLELEFKRNFDFKQSLLGCRILKEYDLSPIQRLLMSSLDDIRLKNTVITHNLTSFDGVGRIKNAVVQLIEENSLLWSAIEKKGEAYYINEYEYSKSVELPYLDISGYSIAAKNEIISYTKLKLYQTPFELFQNVLFRILIIKTDDLNYLLCLGFNHLIFDGESHKILSKKVDNILHINDTNTKEINSSEKCYADYVSFLKNINYDEIDLNSYFKINEYMSSIKSLAQTFSVKPIEYDYYELNVSLIDPSYKDDYIEILFICYARLLNKLINSEMVPVNLVSNGRVYSGHTFYNTLGDFHDIIPYYFDVNLDSTEIIKMMKNYNSFIKDKSLNFINYYFKNNLQQEKNIGIISPFSFNPQFGFFSEIKEGIRNGEMNDLFERKIFPGLNFEFDVFMDPFSDNVLVGYLQNFGFRKEFIKKEFFAIYNKIAIELKSSTKNKKDVINTY